jgi:hypothetical protein
LEIGGHLTGFVGLEMTDEMPLQIQVTSRFYFRQRLLNEIFAKPPLPARCGVANRIHRLQFADGEQSDFFGIPSKLLTGRGNPFLYLGEPE